MDERDEIALLRNAATIAADRDTAYETVDRLNEVLDERDAEIKRLRS